MVQGSYLSLRSSVHNLRLIVSRLIRSRLFTYQVYTSNSNPFVRLNCATRGLQVWWPDIPRYLMITVHTNSHLILHSADLTVRLVAVKRSSQKNVYPVWTPMITNIQYLLWHYTYTSELHNRQTRTQFFINNWFTPNIGVPFSHIKSWPYPFSLPNNLWRLEIAHPC